MNLLCTEFQYIFVRINKFIKYLDHNNDTLIFDNMRVVDHENNVDIGKLIRSL